MFDNKTSIIQSVDFGSSSIMSKIAEIKNIVTQVDVPALQIMLEAKLIEVSVSDEDKLKNFKSIAERLKCEPEFVANVYLLKHMDSVRNFVLEGVEASDEPIEGRLRDIRNYCLLLGALIKEKREQK